jgi:hypothetical protein
MAYEILSDQWTYGDSLEIDMNVKICTNSGQFFKFDFYDETNEQV